MTRSNVTDPIAIFTSRYMIGVCVFRSSWSCTAKPDPVRTWSVFMRDPRRTRTVRGQVACREGKEELEAPRSPDA